MQFDYQTINLAKTKLPKTLKDNKYKKVLGENTKYIPSKLSLDNLDDVLADILTELKGNTELQKILKEFLLALTKEVKTPRFLRRAFTIVLDIVLPASYTTYKYHDIMQKLNRIDKLVNQ